MSEITREEVRAWLEAMSRPAVIIGGDVAPVVDTTHATACYRLALAALEDAERVDALAYDLEGGPIFDEYAKHDVHEIAATDAHIETDERGAYCRAFRAAIDRARGGGDT